MRFGIVATKSSEHCSDVVIADRLSQLPNSLFFPVPPAASWLFKPHWRR
jgi:hypothetical protein